MAYPKHDTYIRRPCRYFPGHYEFSIVAQPSHVAFLVAGHGLISLCPMTLN